MHADPSKWASHTTGGIDALNTFYMPEEFDGEMPVVPLYSGIIPRRMLKFGGQMPEREDDAVHFFIDDYRFERVWNRPEYYAAKYAGKILLSPDFSLYADYPRILQKWNLYRSRWLTCYFSSVGIRVIPVATWGLEDSYEYCFDGLPEGSVVAISTRGCRYCKEEFSNGVDAMMERVNPGLVLCCGDFWKFYVNDVAYENVIVYKLGKGYMYTR